jgi:hypothetical protein
MEIARIFLNLSYSPASAHDVATDIVTFNIVRTSNLK